MASLMAPFMPSSSKKLADILGINEDLVCESDKEGFPEGHQIGEPEILFHKIEDEVIQVEIDKLNVISSPADNEV